MNNQNKTIIVLIIVIALLGVFFALKVTGVIKSEPKQIDISEETNTSSTITQKDAEQALYEGVYKAGALITQMSIIIGIVATAISLVLAMGTCKLYLKMDMPEWAAKFTFAQACITLVVTALPSTTSTIISFIIAIISLIVSYYYFKAVGMSGWWILSPLIPIVGILVFLIVYIISNIRLGDMFNKGIGFKIGLAILPGIFQPILGFQKD